ncbi:MAG: FecR domain-containing protein [Pyrinomonadaceae bacterium]
MRKASRSLPLLFTLPLIFSVFLAGQAQNRERFVISAKAGGINAVTGRTGVHAQGSSEWEQLTIKDNLEAGDVVKTGVDGRVEMLLNPGSYMRVAENSEFELTNNSLENLEVRLIRGTAIVEATGADDTELMINITTPHTKMVIVRRGLYRVNVVPGDATELIVRKGRVLLSDSQQKVKGGRKLIFSGLTFSIAKLERADKEKDAFDNWSQHRAETVAQANRRITSRDRNLLLSSLNNSWYYGFSARSSGIWLFHPGYNCYTFLPFYFGWGSPYGGAYSNAFYPAGRWGGYNSGSTGNPYPRTGGGSGQPPASTGGQPAPTYNPQPPPPPPPPTRAMDSPRPEPSMPNTSRESPHRNNPPRQ